MNSPEELWDREYQRWLNRHEKRRARRQWRMANEPGYAERIAAYHRGYRTAHLQEYQAYNREWMRRYRASQR